MSGTADVAGGIPMRGWSRDAVPGTTLVVIRHGVTKHTAAKRFSGGLGGDNPPLSEAGRAQVSATARWLAPTLVDPAAVVTSPVRRTRESAEIVAELLGLPIEEEPGFAETEFGQWDGLSMAEVAERYPADLEAWYASPEMAPPGGESFVAVRERVLAGLDRTLAAHPGRTVVVLSHVTPIKLLVAHALSAPLSALYTLELSPASATIMSFYPDQNASLRLYNGLPALPVAGAAGRGVRAR
ncbi:MAG: histidine phosphatase family protein [Nocardioides sp.]|uniref:histidine phosphatase family protein n=1 Tax=Nocardioides sp. TaxID=35761 RepID=UPI0039E510F5